ncbi:MAG: hypothetical protein ACFFAH_12585 [Promethearchaeota archaeon]
MVTFYSIEIIKNNIITEVILMEQDKKILVALAVLLTVSYGLSMAADGVSIPGCGETAP